MADVAPPEFSLTPAQQAWLVANNAVPVENLEGGQVKAVTSVLAEAVVDGDGAADLSDPPDSEVTVPVDQDHLTQEIGNALRRPMTVAATRWKVQALVGGKALVVPHIDARLVMDRLDVVVGAQNWEENFHTVDWGGGSLMCELTVLGHTHKDVGEGRDAKAMRSDSLKRAAVNFGIGRFLYAIVKVKFPTDGPLIYLQKKTLQNGKVKMVPWLTPAGEEELPRIYTRWLWEHGVKAYGNPIDHGDSFAAGGDFEAGVDVDAPEEDPDAPPTEEDKKRQQVAAGVLGKGKGK